MRHFTCVLAYIACIVVLAFTQQTSTFPQWIPTPAHSFNASNYSQTSPQVYNSIQAYNNTAFVQALNLVVLAIWDAVRYDNENPMLGPALRAPVVYEALDTIKEAIRITNLPEVSPSSSNGTIPSNVVGNDLSSKDVVYLRNESPTDICFFVEFTSGNFSCPDICGFDRDALPGESDGIIVPAYSTATVYTNPGFNGPFNTIINGVRGTIDGKPALMHGIRGARHEINYASDPDGVWYDIDYEFGLSNSTLAPTDGRNNTNGLSSIQGETNILAKANDAWQNLTAVEKWALVAHPKYIGVDDGFPGNLTRLYHDKQAPAEVNFFLQMTTGLQGYVVAGSYLGFPYPAGSLEAQMKPIADYFSWHVKGPHNMTVVAY